jgi:hypothetical protein
MSRSYILKTKEIFKFFGTRIAGTFIEGGNFIHFPDRKSEQNPQPVKNKRYRPLIFFYIYHIQVLTIYTFRYFK